MSVAQTTRLIRTFVDHGVLQLAPYQRHCFPTRYTPEDIALLAEVDRAHQRLSGPVARQHRYAILLAFALPDGDFATAEVETLDAQLEPYEEPQPRTVKQPA